VIEPHLLADGDFGDPCTTTQRLERWKCFCNESRAPGTQMRVTLIARPGIDDPVESPGTIDAAVFQRLGLVPGLELLDSVLDPPGMLPRRERGHLINLLGKSALLELRGR
jgi:hypothetical protein